LAARGEAARRGDSVSNSCAGEVSLRRLVVGVLHSGRWVRRAQEAGTGLDAAAAAAAGCLAVGEWMETGAMGGRWMRAKTLKWK